MHKNCLNVVQILCKYCRNIVTIVHDFQKKYCEIIVQIFCICIIQILYKSHANILHILSKFSTNIEEILYNSCANIRQILYEYYLKSGVKIVQ